MENKYSAIQLTWLLVLRIFIGWHFLFEGMVKVLNPGWSASAYLMDSQGIFRSFFAGMAENPVTLNLVNIMNEWALVLAGLGLLLGCFTRLSCLGGIFLLLLYTMSHPSLIGVDYMMSFEGSYFLIDKNLIELVALGVLFVFPTGRVVGIDRILVKILPAGFQKFMI